MVWHWAHESLENCDSWYEPKSEWHCWWQSQVHEDLTEIIMPPHVADIKLSSGKVIEIQHSSLPVEVVSEREQFYGNMIWIFDGSEFEDRMTFKEGEFEDGTPYSYFKFKKPRQYIIQAKKFPIYIDFSDFVFKVKRFKMYTNTSEWTGKEYNSWYCYGDVMQKDIWLFKEIFGKDYIGNRPANSGTSTATPNGPSTP